MFFSGFCQLQYVPLNWLVFPEDSICVPLLYKVPFQLCIFLSPLSLHLCPWQQNSLKGQSRFADTSPTSHMLATLQSDFCPQNASKTLSLVSPIKQKMPSHSYELVISALATYWEHIELWRAFDPRLTIQRLDQGVWKVQDLIFNWQKLQILSVEKYLPLFSLLRQWVCWKYPYLLSIAQVSI